MTKRVEGFGEFDRPPEALEQSPIKFAEECLRAIQFESEHKPRLEMGVVAAWQFKRLLDRLSAEQFQTVGVVRCWNKTRAELEGLIERFKAMKEQCPSIAGLVVAINADKDQDQITTKKIEDILKYTDPGFEIVPIQIREYSWTAGLNGPAALLAEGLRRAGKKMEGVSMLHLSFGVSFPLTELKKLSNELEKGGVIFTIRDGADTEAPSRTEVSSFIRDPELLAKSDSNVDSLISFARNTACVLPLESIVRFKGYRNSLNASGGMEDHDFGVRLLLQALANKDWGAAKKLLKAISHPIRYENADWSRLDEAEKRDRIASERLATKKVISDLISMKQDVDQPYQTPESEQDFIFH